MKNLKTNIIILVVICAIVLYISLKDDFEEILTQIYSINLWWFLLACVLMMLYFIFRAFEMKNLVRTVDKKYPFRKALGIVVIGQYFANITPSSLGAQPSQIYFLSKDKIKGTQGTRIVIKYNVTYQIALIIISFITILLAYYFNIFADLSSSIALKKLTILSFLIHVSVLAVLLGVNFSKKANSFIVKKGIRLLEIFRIIKDKAKALNNWEIYLNNFHSESKKLFDDRVALVKGVMWNGLAIISLYSIPLMLIYAIGDFKSLELMGTTVASSYTNIISTFMPSPGGAGAFEYFFTQFFSVFLIGATLMTVMLLWRMVTYYFVLLVGSIILIFYKEGIEDL